MSDQILSVENLSMRFGGIVAVNDLSFTAERRNITALIGPNGAGKTTVFNCITGFYKPSGGSIRLNHDDAEFRLERLNDFRISKVAKVARTFQNIRLFPGMTALENLRTPFRPHGRVSAGNASGLTDGATGALLVAAEVAEELGLPVRMRMVSFAYAGVPAETMGDGPIPATEKALRKAGLTIDDIGIIEINEAFAVQVLASVDDLGIDPDRLNVHGGAIALGHPFGSTGARITTTLLNGLASRDGQFGLETMCIGGGQGMAIIYERLS